MSRVVVAILENWSLLYKNVSLQYQYSTDSAYKLSGQYVLNCIVHIRDYLILFFTRYSIGYSNTAAILIFILLIKSNTLGRNLR